MPPGRPASYRTTGPREITLVSSLSLGKCKGNVVIPNRQIEWRGAALPIVNAMQRKAAFIYAFGHVVHNYACDRCARGGGPFWKCVVAFDDKGYMAKGVCANCYWLHRTDDCSRRHVLPCAKRASAGRDLGIWEEACKAHCGGRHVPVVAPFVIPSVVTATAAIEEAEAEAAPAADDSLFVKQEESDAAEHEGEEGGHNIAV